jgi:hypothetical protein
MKVSPYVWFLIYVLILPHPLDLPIRERKSLAELKQMAQDDPELQNLSEE